MAKNGFFDQHWTDSEGRPAGGVSSGRGFVISWQNGPLGRGATRKDPNGAFCEDVIASVIGRLEFYQTGRETSTEVTPNSPARFWCKENEAALESLKAALAVLESRTAGREARQVEGTHAV